MKYLITTQFAIALTALACSPGGVSSPGGQVLGEVITATVGHTTAHGGVDVGNMQAGIATVPQTSATMDYPGTWTASTTEKALTLKNSSGSNIQAERVFLADLASPSALSLKQYFTSKNHRAYLIININGLPGVESKSVRRNGDEESDIYLLSETSGLLHITSVLLSADNGIESGEGIIQTTRVRYKGVPVERSVPKTIVLSRDAYSFMGDCFAATDSGCGGVEVRYDEAKELSIYENGSSSGRITELGNEVAFDSVRIEEAFLVAPKTKIPISDIYAVFSPQGPSVEHGSTTPQVGGVYLVRTMDWPAEDLIVKIRVDAVTEDSLTLTYEKLVYVPPAELEKQIQQMKDFTATHEQPVNEGEVTLYDRNIWNNYYYASFNFQFSNSGNAFMNGNSWDIMYANGLLLRAGIVGDLGTLLDLGDRDLDSLGEKDYPDLKTALQFQQRSVTTGHTYIYFNYRADGLPGGKVIGAVQVLGQNEKEGWVRLKFRRLLIGEPDQFQTWLPQALPPVASFALSADHSRYFPFSARQDEPPGRAESELLSFVASTDSADDDELQCDSRPYDNGFVKFGAEAKFEKITEADFPAQLKSYVAPKVGDVIGVKIETFTEFVVVVLRIDQSIRGKSLQFTARYLRKDKAQLAGEGVEPIAWKELPPESLRGLLGQRHSSTATEGVR